MWFEFLSVLGTGLLIHGSLIRGFLFNFEFGVIYECYYVGFALIVDVNRFLREICVIVVDMNMFLWS